ncbi:DUF4123 domain-containing protein [Arhodomonas aquaeolei]|uniref:DUF4123 domain-containing protein n=1 Tax=Arhodomonas aquaeolei TaxID=2369 RepID=UPI002168F465|nr:DUF4123 domain-containing protein [Arhodomonas aquaeolei]MCS4504987.1 DUF4123 domain-containing protein [Arhodomonas aquaeolei]
MNAASGTQPYTLVNHHDLSGLLQGGALYELIDPATSDPGPGDASPQACETVVNPFTDQPPAERLRLQPVTGTPQRIWTRLQAHCASPPRPDEPRPVCGWLIFAGAVQGVARYLSRQLRQTKPSGRAALLRYYDPRVMERLLSLCSDTQLAALLGPVDHWLFVGRTGCIRHASPHDGAHRSGERALAPEQWDAIDRIGLVNRTLAVCTPRTGIASWTDNTIIRLDRLLAIAGREGITDPGSRIAFALHGLGSTDSFHRHPVMRHVLARCRQGEDYRALTRTWGTHDWRRIAEESRGART